MWTGVTHGEELRSLQHYEMLLPPIVDGVDRMVSDQLISMWYNFVAYGYVKPHEFFIFYFNTIIINFE